MDYKDVTNSQDLEALWKETQTRQELLESRNEELFQKIDAECADAIQESTDYCVKEYEAASEGVRKLLGERRKTKAALEKKGGFVFLIAILTILALVLIKLFVIKFEIINPFLSYCIIIAVSFIFAIIMGSVRKKRLTKELDLINKDEEIAAMDARIAAHDEETKKKIEFIKKEKYQAEFQEIEQSLSENNYEQVRKLMIKNVFGDVALFYFKKFAFLGKPTYTIKVDGVETASSGSKNSQIIAMNPGYHTIELVMYSYFADDVYTCKFRFQVNADALPIFIVCDCVDGQNGTCREVDADEFEIESGKNLL